jgi:two-component system alkaline phosphatase synthesis response regulator PhoP
MQHEGNILVVDDDQPILNLLTEVLVDEGYTVRTALTPVDALLFIDEHCPDLILCDLHLPGMNGDALARKIKKQARIDIPIILVTADVQAQHRLSMECIDFFLPKPFDLDELIDCVAKYIPLNCTV